MLSRGIFSALVEYLCKSTKELMKNKIRIYLKNLDKASMFGKALEFLAKNTMLPSDAKKQDPIFTKR